VRRELESGKRTKNIKKEKVRGPSGTTEEGEKNQEGEEENTKTFPKSCLKIMW